MTCFHKWTNPHSVVWGREVLRCRLCGDFLWGDLVETQAAGVIWPAKILQQDLLRYPDQLYAGVER